jgi:hypothetical protein
VIRASEATNPMTPPTIISHILSESPSKAPPEPALTVIVWELVAVWGGVDESVAFSVTMKD